MKKIKITLGAKAPKITLGAKTPKIRIKNKPHTGSKGKIA